MQSKLKQNFVLFSVKLIEYIHFSAVCACFNLFVGPFPRIKIYFFLLSICGDELISTPKTITFLPFPQLGCEKILFYQIQYHVQNIYTDQYLDILLV